MVLCNIMDMGAGKGDRMQIKSDWVVVSALILSLTPWRPSPSTEDDRKSIATSAAIILIPILGSRDLEVHEARKAFTCSFNAELDCVAGYISKVYLHIHLV